MLILAALVSGCFPAQVPTQAHPTCSWATEVPSNADALCASVFRTLSALARASARGDTGTIRALVLSRPVARRILAYSRRIRTQGATDFHVVPSITLEMTSGGEIGAGFYLLGKTRAGRINAPQTLYLKSRGTGAVVLHDQPGQEW